MPLPPWKKLSPEDREIIYKLWVEDGIAQIYLAQRFNVSPDCIRREIAKKKKEPHNDSPK
jgi:DeoR/GlpR family transcriptional regulator of sugar metabolism